MQEDPRPYFADRQSAIKRLPVKPALRTNKFPHHIPSYKKRDLSIVVEKCGVEIVGQTTCGVIKTQKSKTRLSVQNFYDACITNGLWRSEFHCYNDRKTGGLKKTLTKVCYAEMLMKI